MSLITRIVSAFIHSPLPVAAIIAFCLVALMGCDDGAVADAETRTLAVPSGTLELSGEPVNAVLVLGNGACTNRPALTALPQGAETVLNAVLDTGGSFGIVTVEGTPRSLGMRQLASSAQTTEVRAQENAATLEGLATSIAEGAAAATTPEADPLAAVKLAARDLASVASEGSEQVLIVADSLLGTTGALDFAGNVGLSSDPEEVVAYLRGLDACPDLADVHVLVWYAGDTAAPQEALTDTERANLTAIWLAVLTEGCGAASVEFMTDVPASSDAGGGGAAALPEVSTVAVSETPRFSAAALTAGTTIALGTAERVGFLPDSDTFRDEAGAQSTLAELAQALVASRALIAIEGNAATPLGTYASDWPQRLSLQRAQRVADELEAGGVPGGCIVSVVGNGTAGGTYSAHVTDVDEQGARIPAAAERNRCTVIAVVGTSV